MCRVVNLKRGAKYNIYIGRFGRDNLGEFGNQFIVGVHGARGECVKLFEQWFYGDSPEAKAMRLKVKEKIKPSDTLGCFCKPDACHGDVIAGYVNNGYKRPTSCL